METEEIQLGYLNLIVHIKKHIKICIADVVKRLGLHKSSFPVVVSVPDVAILLHHKREQLFFHHFSKICDACQFVYQVNI